MRYFKLTLAYDGTSYAGWQVQVGKPTVQAVLEAALKKITGEDLRAVASGRTDAGVHALGQVVSFKTQSQMSCEVFCRALNGNLPRDVHVWDVREMPEGFHAIRDAIGKRYRYVIQDGPAPDLFVRHYSWRIPQTLDAEAMHAASQSLLGTRDFSSFEASGSPRKNSIRTVTDIFVVRPRGSPHAPGRTALPGRHDDGPEGPSYTKADISGSGMNTLGRLEIEVAADGFLYNMVRNIVGALVEVGRGAQPPEWIAQVLSAQNRQVRYPTAPPHGLFLVEVYYK
jgi:tRNA pseudouridine38-40 synthase